METTVQIMYYLANQLFHAAVHVGNSYWNNYKTRKEVETFNQLSLTTQQPLPSPPPPPPSPAPPPSPPPPSPPKVNPSIKIANCIPEESTVIKPQPKTGNIIEIALIRRLVSPKSPLMIFNELVKDVNIQLQEHQGVASNHTTGYTATFEIGGKTYTGNDISKKQAKQKACESYLKTIFKDQIRSLEMEVGENTSKSKTITPHQKDFPWSQFASLAMRNLINQ